MRGVSKIGLFVKSTIRPVAYPSGTRLLFDQDTPPTGWTRDTTADLNDRVWRIAVGTRTSGGSWTVSGLSAPVHSHTLPDIISHTHSASGASHTHTLTSYPYDAYFLVHVFPNRTDLLWEADYVEDASYSATVGDSGVTSPGTNSVAPAISSDGSWRPLYRDVIVAQKD